MTLLVFFVGVVNTGKDRQRFVEQSETLLYLPEALPATSAMSSVQEVPRSPAVALLLTDEICPGDKHPSPVCALNEFWLHTLGCSAPTVGKRTNATPSPPPLPWRWANVLRGRRCTGGSVLLMALDSRNARRRRRRSRCPRRRAKMTLDTFELPCWGLYNKKACAPFRYCLVS